MCKQDAANLDCNIGCLQFSLYHALVTTIPVEMALCMYSFAEADPTSTIIAIVEIVMSVCMCMECMCACMCFCVCVCVYDWVCVGVNAVYR